MNTSVLSLEKFAQIKKMIQSSDPENQMLALQLLEQYDFVSNGAFILFCKKYSSSDNDFWKEHAPTTYSQIESIKVINVERNLTFKDILMALNEINASYTQVKFFLDTFSEYLKNQLTVMGFDFIDNLELNIVLKKHYAYEQSEELRESV